MNCCNWHILGGFRWMNCGNDKPGKGFRISETDRIAARLRAVRSSHKCVKCTATILEHQEALTIRPVCVYCEEQQECWLLD